MGKRLYEVLSIPENSDAATIKKAFRSCALKYHPDKNNHDKGSTEKFQEITKAYEVLSDPRKRAEYDDEGNTPVTNTSTKRGNANDLFSHFFGQHFPSDPFFNDFFDSPPFAQSRSRKKQKPIRHKLVLSIEEIYHTQSVKLGINKKTVCASCRGKGGHVTVCTQCRGRGVEVIERQLGSFSQSMRLGCRMCRGEGSFVSDSCSECFGHKVRQLRKVLDIDVPAGIESGTQMVFEGEGNEDPESEPGDVVVDVYVEDSSQWHRSENDLVYNATISLRTALTGGFCAVDHPCGETLRLVVPRGELVKPGDVKLVEGYGLPCEGGYGDLLVKFSVKFPQNLKEASIAFLERALPPEEPTKRGVEISMDDCATKKRRLSDDV